VSIDISSLLKVGHFYGFLMWLGSLFGALRILQAHADADEGARKAFLPLERSAGMTMDIGATLAIVFGLLLVFVPEGGTALFKVGGFMHVKLTLVAVLIGLHVIVRRMMVQAKKGNVSAPAPFLFPALVILVLAILFTIVAKPF